MYYFYIEDVLYYIPKQIRARPEIRPRRISRAGAGAGARIRGRDPGPGPGPGSGAGAASHVLVSQGFSPPRFTI